MSRTLQAFSHLHRIHAGFDQLAGELEQLLKTPVCITNCGKCCEVNTPQWTALEAMNAVSVLLGSGGLPEALKRAEYWLTRKKDVAASYEGMLAGCYLPAKIKAEHWALANQPCPMLDDEKQCLIHAARPLTCRSYGVTRSCDINFCPRPAGAGEPVNDRLYMRSPDLQADIKRLWKSAKEINPNFVVYGFVPTMLYRAARETEFYAMVQDNKIASAKIVGTDLDTTLLWQEQQDSIRKGELPDMVAMKN